MVNLNDKTLTGENHVEFWLVAPTHLTEDTTVEAGFRGCQSCATTALAGLFLENERLFMMVAKAMAMAMARKEELAKERGEELVNYRLN